MIIKTCPYGEHKSGQSWQPLLGKHNIIAHHVSNGDFIPTHTGPFSVKYVIDGAETYYFNKEKYAVDRSKYIIINQGQPYASSINSKSATASLCIFFSTEFLQDGFRCLTQPTATLLDNDHPGRNEEINFFQKVHWKDEAMHLQLTSLVSSLQAQVLCPGFDVNEWCSKLLEILIVTHRQEQYHYNNLNVLKRQTKEEIYTRLNAAVDFLHAYFHTPVSLQQLNAVACLSPFHFLRLFKQAFNVTPHQYLTTIRLRHAAHLLKTTADPISCIGYACGFNDESSFTRLFKRHHGVTPTAYKKLR